MIIGIGIVGINTKYLFVMDFSRIQVSLLHQYHTKVVVGGNMDARVVRLDVNFLFEMLCSLVMFTLLHEYEAKAMICCGVVGVNLKYLLVVAHSLLKVPLFYVYHCEVVVGECAFIA